MKAKITIYPPEQHRKYPWSKKTTLWNGQLTYGDQTFISYSFLDPDSGYETKEELIAGLKQALQNYLDHQKKYETIEFDV